MSSEERDIKYTKIRHCYGVLRPSLEGYQVQTEIPYESGTLVGAETRDPTTYHLGYQAKLGLCVYIWFAYGGPHCASGRTERL